MEISSQITLTGTEIMPNTIKDLDKMISVRLSEHTQTTLDLTPLLIHRIARPPISSFNGRNKKPIIGSRLLLRNTPYFSKETDNNRNNGNN